MLASQRHNRIQSLLQENGAVTIAGLMETFAISMETARRDLAAMEKAGLLTRVHGGALPLNTPRHYTPLKDRMQSNQSQKQAIAHAAAALVEEGDYIAIGGGSTALAFAQALRQQVQTLTVVTYSIDVFHALQDLPGYRLLLTGGDYLPSERMFSGPRCRDFLNGVFVRKSFIFPTALSLEAGITCYNQTFPEQLQAIVRQCDHVYILADSSKFQTAALYQVVPMQQDFTYITDTDLPEALNQLYAEKHLHFIYP